MGRKSCAKLISTVKNQRIQITSTKTTATTTTANDREIDQQRKKKRKKFVVRLLQRKLKKLSHRTLLYLTSTHFYPTMMMSEVAKTIQIKTGNKNLQKSPGFCTKKIATIITQPLLFLKSILRPSDRKFSIRREIEFQKINTVK